jgi:hypothetical protein
MRGYETQCLAVLVLALGESSCSQGSMICPGNVSPPPTVTVVDTSNGENVCDAQVTASNGPSTLRIVDEGAHDAALSDASCTYSLYPPSQSGTYTIGATAPGLHMTGPVPTLNIEVGQCGPTYSTESITITMSP